MKFQLFGSFDKGTIAVDEKGRDNSNWRWKKPSLQRYLTDTPNVNILATTDA